MLPIRVNEPRRISTPLQPNRLLTLEAVPFNIIRSCKMNSARQNTTDPLSRGGHPARLKRLVHRTKPYNAIQAQNTNQTAYFQSLFGQFRHQQPLEEIRQHQQKKRPGARHQTPIGSLIQHHQGCSAERQIWKDLQ